MHALVFSSNWLLTKTKTKQQHQQLVLGENNVNIGCHIWFERNGN